MPKSKRDFLKREIGHGLHNLDMAELRCYNVLQEFEKHHPELASLLGFAILAIDEVKEIIGDFCKHAWGSTPERVKRYRNTGQEWKEKHNE